MKFIYCFILISVIQNISFAQSDTLSYASANQFYEQHEYESAANIYENILQQKGGAFEIYYNLANSYYKLNNMGKAILNYERALQLKPGDDDVEFNLALANLKIKDKIDPVNEFFIYEWWREFTYIFTLKTWMVISLCLVWIAFIGYAIFKLTEGINLRKAGFSVFIFCLCLFAIAGAATLSKQSFDNNYIFSIITEPSVIVKNEPSEAGTNIYILHEGLKLQVLDDQGEWSKIKMPDGNIGWLNTNSVEMI